MRRAPVTTALGSLVLAFGLAACGGGAAEAEDPDGGGEPAAVTVTAEAGSVDTADREESPGDAPDDEVAGDAPDLAGTSWLVTHHYSDEYGGTTNVWPRSELDLAFATDGTLTGSTGCNELTATYEVSGAYVTERGFDDDLGQAMTISDVEATAEPCPDDDLALQEAEFLEALTQVQQWTVGVGFGGEEQLLLLHLDDGLQVEGSPAG